MFSTPKTADPVPETVAVSLVAEQEQIERMAAIRSALASQRIEGLEPDPRAVADAERWARGEITIGAAVADFKMRVRLDMP
ncbi:Uncharacterised protein [Bordetella ansorpii]|uniref:Antitoxin VbhA domain-containing protein n=1 Tax=Bordetella ansorpii TaxID=288768 RepID=A0A157PDB0_9BORD|nr:hypothetical protein [Bordetella ansorpii]SAI30889.1 Uncharacterised protein [Bordetella ansorpii]